MPVIPAHIIAKYLVAHIWPLFNKAVGQGFVGNMDDYLREVILVKCKTEDDLRKVVGLEAKGQYISDIPHLAAEYSEKNLVPVTRVPCHSGMKYWWRCKKIMNGRPLLTVVQEVAVVVHVPGK